MAHSLDQKIANAREIMHWCKSNKLVFDYWAAKTALEKLEKQKQKLNSAK